VVWIMQMKNRSVLAAVLIGAAQLTMAGHSFAEDGVKIGVLSDLSGPYAEITGKSAVQATELAIADFGGKALGQPITMISADHQNKADVGLAIAREWLYARGVTAILDANNSAVALAVNELVRSRKKIFLARAASDDLTQKACSPDTTTQWVASSAGLARAVILPAARAGLDGWFFITINYAFGHTLEEYGKRAILSAGRSVIGATRFPSGTSDFSSYIVDAQSRGAKTIAIAAAGADVANITKQIREFGLNVDIVPLYLAETDIDAVGQDMLTGVHTAVTFFWNRSQESRAFAARFKALAGRLPTFAAQQQYSAVTHYLKAVQAAGSTEAEAVSSKMRELPVIDGSGYRATVRGDGRLMNGMFVVSVKPKNQSNEQWDYFNNTEVVGAEELYPPAEAQLCPLFRGK
jgi:branched-chain amino acid transport system substrate-binding protein